MDFKVMGFKICHHFRFWVLVIFFYFLGAFSLVAYPFATFVMDAKSGETLYGKNSSQKLHPASLTKMMTLYLVFHEVENNRLGLDQKVVISKNAAREPPSKFGYKPGARVSVRHLIRAAAIRSANDAATALGEAVSGSEKKFGEYMTKAALAMGMKNTKFKNAHGLTSTGHLSTAKDMAILSRRLMYDFPEYYHLFGRTKVFASGKTLYNTNRKFLAKYSGSDGIKTGFTSAAGYNLAASAERGNKRVIAIVFGSGSVNLRTKRVSELLDIGFYKAVARKGTTNLPSLRLDLLVRSNVRPGAVLNLLNKPLKRPDIFSFGGSKSKQLMDEAISDILNSGTITAAYTARSESRPLPRPDFIGPDEKIDENGDFYNRLASKLIDILGEEEKQKNYGILVGSYFTEYNAKKDLPRLTLSDLETLSNLKGIIITGVVEDKKVFRVNFNGLSKLEANKACQKLSARKKLCEIVKVEK